MLGRDTGLAIAQDRRQKDSFDRPEVDPRLTFRYQDWEGAANPSSKELYPAPDEIPNWMIAGDLRVPVDGTIPSDVASGKTDTARQLSSDEPYVEPGERSVDLQFAVTDANPEGSIATTMYNLREIGEALAYIQDQRVPANMVLDAFKSRVQENQAPDVVQPIVLGESTIDDEVVDLFESRSPFEGSFERFGRIEEEGFFDEEVVPSYVSYGNSSDPGKFEVD